ncbi:MAG TPA: hypothetical protein VGD30_04090 [Telluria sp.]
MQEVAKIFELDYESTTLYKDATQTLQNHRSVAVRIRGRKAVSAARGMENWIAFHVAKSEGRKDWRALLRMVRYGFFTVELWGIVNYAELEAATISTSIEGSDLVVTFTFD